MRFVGHARVDHPGRVAQYRPRTAHGQPDSAATRESVAAAVVVRVWKQQQPCWCVLPVSHGRGGGGLARGRSQ